MSESHEGNGWKVSEKMVLSELVRLSEGLTVVLERLNEQAVCSARMETKLDALGSLETRVQTVEKKTERLEVKAGILSLLAGAVSSAVLTFLGIPSRG